MGANSKPVPEQFTKLTRNLMSTPAWLALPPAAKALYVRVRLEWKGPKANNNGKIQFSVRQAAHYLGVSIQTAAKAFHELQAKGFLVVTEIAHPGLSGQASGNFYELTEIVSAGQKGPGRCLYKRWKEGHDFTVQKARAHNPSGRNGKQKSDVKIEVEPSN